MMICIKLPFSTVERINSVDIDRAGVLLAVGGVTKNANGTVMVSRMDAIRQNDFTTIRELKTSVCERAAVQCVRWSHNMKMLASSCNEGTITLCRVREDLGSLILAYLNPHKEKTAVNHIEFRMDDVLLASAGDDCTIAIADVRTRKVVKRLDGFAGAVDGLAWRPDGQQLVSQSTDFTLRVWRSRDWSQVASINERFRDALPSTAYQRPDWAIDGSHIVAVHALNGGGSTAQIILADSWNLGRDYCGFSKAVTVVVSDD